MLSNIVEVFMHFWTELRGVKRVRARGDITVFRGTYKFDNFYFNYHIEANQVNFSPFSRFEIRTPGMHRSVPPNVYVGTLREKKGSEDESQKGTHTFLQVRKRIQKDLLIA